MYAHITKKWMFLGLGGMEGRGGATGGQPPIIPPPPPPPGVQLPKKEGDSSEEIERSQGMEQKNAVMMAQLPQVRLKKAVAKYRGENGGIQLESWLGQVEAMCSAMGIVDDQSKINCAKDEIDYSCGEAKVIAKKAFRNWEHFKEVFRGWACASPPTLYLDVERFFGCRWKPKQTFLQYTEELTDLFDRMTSKPQSKLEWVEVYYFYMVGTIIAQLPESLKKEYLMKKVEIGSRLDFDDWCLEINVKLNNYNLGKPKTNPMVWAMDQGPNRSNGGGRRDGGSGNRFQKFGKPNRWEEINGKCGRCLSKTHFRVNCNARDPKCNWCEGSHEFFECPRRNKRNGQHQQNRKLNDRNFLG